MEILQELPVSQWPVLQKKLKELWPLNLPGYYTLYINLKYPKLREAFNFKVYCPDGDMEHGFLGFFNIDKLNSVVLFSVTSDTSKLEEALLKTSLIDRSKKVSYDIVTSLTAKMFPRLKGTPGFEICEVYPADMHYLVGTTEPFKDMRAPDNTYLSRVKEGDIQRVDETWPYQHSSSHFYFSTFASIGLSYALYSSDTHELISWIFINENCFLCHFYCEEKFRKRGYGEFVLKSAVNVLLKDGNDVYAYTVPGNAKPQTLFKNLGFVRIDDSAFVMAEGKSN
ncbi:unnamed protein product [Chrysodeixis includens]|uniref:N-acetyltransferase domain-containing protein n=1 Tax=Chrysodeixis includens TaxID=689277 RepID=A0A9P0FRG0_CHRIL|nr:unnamed protein product [Chrysodeixis includens]